MEVVVVLLVEMKVTALVLGVMEFAVVMLVDMKIVVNRTTECWVHGCGGGHVLNGWVARRLPLLCSSCSDIERSH